MSRPADYRPTRLFFPPDPADVDYDPAPRLRHWCNNPECGRCDEIAEIACQCDGTADECEQCGRGA